jgi:hypothetical protein
MAKRIRTKLFVCKGVRGIQKKKVKGKKCKPLKRR